MGEEEKKQGSEKPLEKMTVKELREMAKEIPEIAGVHAMKKDELLAVLKKARESEKTKEDKKTTEKPLEKMTAKELREMAKEIPGVAGVHAMKKDELLAVIKEARGIKDEGLKKKKIVKKEKPTLSVKDLKEKIVRLREEKKMAQEARNKKKIGILRRRINRLKKQTRRVAHA